MSTLIEKFVWKNAVLIGVGLWVFGFFFGWALMSALGINPAEEDEDDFNIDHEDYWTFEAIMVPVFVILGLAALYWYFRSSEIDPEIWITEALLVGIAIMAIQFVLDLIFLAIILGGGIEYFFALVTVSYLLIPIWALLAGYFVRVYQAPS
ncbi:MAG: hypothetical protein ACXACI_03260 [Candidatus Hodarchaeales archaeon]|jgi:hypothetical protein